MDFDKAYSLLNEKQRLAVDTIEGPVMVVAGPGTGKTQVLAMRIANILKQTELGGRNILALTFTESGAMAMRERLVSLVGPAGYYVQIATFHGFCSDLIARHPDRFGLSEESAGISELERVQLISTIIAREKLVKLKPTGAPELYVRAILKAIGDLKREAVSVERFGEIIAGTNADSGQANITIVEEKDTEKLEELALIYALYEQELKKIHRYDFEDMIGLVRSTWETDPGFLRLWQEQYQYFLVDEYQDTNTSQNSILFSLASFWGQQANVFVVGDPDQAIYRFQGASMENLLEFKVMYQEATIIRLEQNYRSTQMILDGSHALIGNNSWGGWTFFEMANMKDVDSGQASMSDEQRPEFFTPLQSVGKFAKQKGNVTRVEFANDTLEQLYIVQEIKRELVKGTRPAEIAVLYRDNAHGAFLADLLTREKIPVILESNESVLHTAVVERLVAIIKAVQEIKVGDEGVGLVSLLWYEFVSLEKVDVMKVIRGAKDSRTKLVDYVRDRKYEKLSLAEMAVFDQLRVKLLAWVAASENLRLDAWIDLLLHESGLMSWVLTQSTHMRMLAQIASFARWVRTQVEGDTRLTLGDLLARIELMDHYRLGIEETNLEIQMEAVTLCTAHRSKGREWEVVFVYRAADGVWGNRRVNELIKLPAILGTQALLDKKEKNEDERRLFYVAMTRAKRQLWISSAKEYDDKRSMGAMFVEEIGGANFELKMAQDWDTELTTLGMRLFSLPQSREISLSEQVYLRQIVDSFVMSASALNTYLACPYLFKLQYLLKLPSFPSPAMAYGSAIHAAMEHYYRDYAQSGQAPDRTLLEMAFSAAMEKEWTHGSEFEAWKNRGLKALRLYCDTWQAEMKPGLVSERFFGTTRKPLFLGDIAIQGKIDRIEQVDFGRKTVRIVDYKTGRPKSRNEILGNTANSDGSYIRQLLFYALLTQLDGQFEYTVSEMQLDFVEAGYNGKLKKETFSVEIEELEKLKGVVRDVSRKIRNLEFEHPVDCAVCAASDWKQIVFPDGLPRSVVMNGEQMVLF